MSTTASSIVSEMQPIGWSRQQVQSFASKAALRLGYRPGGDLEEIVAKLGGHIRYNDRDGLQNTGAIKVVGQRNFTISLSPFANARRTRFTIAHELGHYLLHSWMGEKPIEVRREGSGRTEWEANWFAAGFLMPEDEFRRKHSEGFGNAMLAEYFDVSEAAVEIRLSSL